MSASKSDLRYSRQGFLGNQELLESAPVGILGLGGGGSVVTGQLAQLGFGDVVGYDPNQFVEEKHLNRTYGLTVADVDAGISKVQNATRIYLGLQPKARANFHQKRWQDDPLPLKRCKLIFGCLDNLQERSMAESFCRANGIYYIDVGLDVKKIEGAPPVLAGQVITSVPGYSCLRCLGYLTEDLLSREAALYGDAGPRAQVGFGNSVLAGIAVGIAVEMITGWAGEVNHPYYFQYEGNLKTVTPSPRLEHAPKVCEHYPVIAVEAKI